MKLKKLMTITACAAGLLAGGPLALAQAPGDEAPPPFHHHGPPDLTAMLSHTLNLTDAQKTQVASMVKAVQPQLDAIHQQARAASDAIMKQLNTQIRPILTAEQQKRLDALETLRETRPENSQ